MQHNFSLKYCQTWCPLKDNTCVRYTLCSISLNNPSKAWAWCTLSWGCGPLLSPLRYPLGCNVGPWVRSGTTYWWLLEGLICLLEILLLTVSGRGCSWNRKNFLLKQQKTSVGLIFKNSFFIFFSNPQYWCLRFLANMHARFLPGAGGLFIIFMPWSNPRLFILELRSWKFCGWVGPPLFMYVASLLPWGGPGGAPPTPGTL